MRMSRDQVTSIRSFKKNLPACFKGGSGTGFLFFKITGANWDVFCGYAFEQFCEKNIATVLQKLGVTDTVEKVGPYWHKKSAVRNGVQIDLVIECSDRTTYLLECKWLLNKVGIGVVEELSRKERLFPNPKGHTIRKVIIASSGVTEDVFHEEDVTVITLADFFDGL